jgi:hypothetical protein
MVAQKSKAKVEAEAKVRSKAEVEPVRRTDGVEGVLRRACHANAPAATAPTARPIHAPREAVRIKEVEAKVKAKVEIKVKIEPVRRTDGVEVEGGRR